MYEAVKILFAPIYNVLKNVEKKTFNKKTFVNQEECSIKCFFLIFSSTKSVGQQNVYFVGLSRLIKLKALKITINDQVDKYFKN